MLGLFLELCIGRSPGIDANSDRDDSPVLTDTMKPSERVQATLDILGLGIHVVEFGASTATAPEAAAAAGCELGAIVKSLLFLIDGQPHLVLVAGDRMARSEANTT